MLHHSLPPTTISHHHTSKSNIFHIQPQSTSHTIPHPQLFHTTPTFNISTFHTTPYSTSHYTAVSIPPPFHTTTSQSTTYSTSHSHSPHLTPFHIHNYSTPHPQSQLFHTTPTITTIPHHTHNQHHSTFHPTPYSTSHYTSTSWFHITPPLLTSQHIASFSTLDISQQSHSTLHMPHSSPPQFHTTFHITSWLSTSCIMQHSTFCISITFHITPCLKLQLTFHITPHLRSLHHILAHHSTTGPHSTAHHAMHIATVEYKLHIPLSHSLFQTTAHIPHCISTIIPHHTMSNMASNHSTSLSIPQPHFTSCITAHHHIPHAPHHHSTSHHHISRLTWHCMTSHLALHHIAHILHRTFFHPHHSHIRMNKAQHPTSGIAKHSTSHQIPHHTISTSCCVIWWYLTENVVRCGMVCCAGNVIWCENWAVVVRCGMYITSHLIASFHHILHCINPHQTSSLTLFQTTPHSTSDHSSPYHTFHITPTPLFHFAILYFKLHCISHIVQHTTSHCTPFHVTYHKRPHSMYSMAYFRSHHILAILCIAPPHLTSHHIFKTQRCTEFHMPLHILHNCIIPPHLTVITPNSTSHYHVLRNIPHQFTTTFYIPPLTTSALWHWWWLWSVQSEVVTRLWQWWWLWSVQSEVVTRL